MQGSGLIWLLVWVHTLCLQNICIVPLSTLITLRLILHVLMIVNTIFIKHFPPGIFPLLFNYLYFNFILSQTKRLSIGLFSKNKTKTIEPKNECWKVFKWKLHAHTHPEIIYNAFWTKSYRTGFMYYLLSAKDRSHRAKTRNIRYPVMHKYFALLLHFH